jgi:hypothetical protein
VKAALSADVLDVADEWGMTALHLAVAMDWLDAVELLLSAGANRESRYFRTGETALFTAAQNKNERIAAALLRGGANPDAANYWGVTPRKLGLDALFAGVPPGDASPPRPRIQNAEHLAEHHHPRFKIPSRKERETLKVGTAVDIHVHGPRPPAVKVRIHERTGSGAQVMYFADVDPPTQETNLTPGTDAVAFGPEHVATVYRAKK